MRNACTIETALLSSPFFTPTSVIPLVAIALLLPEGIGELQKAVNGCNRSQAPCYITYVQLCENRIQACYAFIGPAEYADNDYTKYRAVPSRFGVQPWTHRDDRGKGRSGNVYCMAADRYDRYVHANGYRVKPSESLASTMAYRISRDVMSICASVQVASQNARLAS